MRVVQSMKSMLGNWNATTISRFWFLFTYMVKLCQSILIAGVIATIIVFYKLYPNTLEVWIHFVTRIMHKFPENSFTLRTSLDSASLFRWRCERNVVEVRSCASLNRKSMYLCRTIINLTFFYIIQGRKIYFLN